MASEALKADLNDPAVRRYEAEVRILTALNLLRDDPDVVNAELIDFLLLAIEWLKPAPE